MYLPPLFLVCALFAFNAFLIHFFSLSIFFICNADETNFSPVNRN